MNRTAAIIAAAGKSSRTNGKDKLFEEIGGKPVIVRSIEAMCKSSLIDNVIIVTRKEYIERINSLCKQHKVCKPIMVVLGGATRAESILMGIITLSYMYGDKCEYIAIHDGARPFTNPKLTDRVITAAKENGAAIPAVRVKDTIKAVADGIIVNTPPRNELYAAQTPQVFSLSLYLAAAGENSDDITDDSLLFEHAGIPVKIVEGDYSNIKITTPDDFIIAKAICEAENILCTE